MTQSLLTINELLLNMSIPAISEQTAKEWLIVGGESFTELNEMANCYAGEIEQSKVAASYYSNSRYI